MHYAVTDGTMRDNTSFITALRYASAV